MISCLTAEARASDFANRFVAANPPRPMPMMHFTDDKGVAYDLSAYKGRYILLNLWATWCGPCTREMPLLNDLRLRYFDYRRFDVVALTEDHDGIAAAQSFYNRYGLHHLPVYVDTSGQAPALLHARGLPTTLFIDPNGRELGRIEGAADWTAPDAIAFLQSKMKERLY